MKTDPQQLLFIGTHGHVRAIDKRTGQDLWTVSLPGTGFTIVSLLYEPGVLFAGSKGVLFALDPANGSILWKNELKGLSYEHMTLATAGGMTDATLLHVQLADEHEAQKSSEDAIKRARKHL